jgi:hypothetical protein
MHRKFGGTRNKDNVLSLSQRPREGDLAGGSVVLLAVSLKPPTTSSRVLENCSLERLVTDLQRPPSSKSLGNTYE